MFWFCLLLVRLPRRLAVFRRAWPKASSDFDAADELYRVYQGRWQALEPIPSGDRITDLELQENGERPTICYRFLGRSLGLNGVAGRYQLLNVEVTPQCTWPVVQRLSQDNGQQIVFLQDVYKTAGLCVLSQGRAVARLFPATPENLDSFVTCLNGGPCGDGLLDGDPPRSAIDRYLWRDGVASRIIWANVLRVCRLACGPGKFASSAGGYGHDGSRARPPKR